MWDVNMSREDEVVLSFYDSLLRKSDVDLLDENQWLNDEIIVFVFEYFEKVQFKDLMDVVGFVHPGTVQMSKFLQGAELVDSLKWLKLDEKQLVFLPINNNDSTRDGGSHWSLLVYDRDTSSFHHYDSFKSANHFAAQQIAKAFERCLAKTSCGFKEMETPQQENGNDCGVYVICLTEYLTRSKIQHCNITIDEFVNQAAVKQRRHQIKEIIYQLAKDTVNS